jgi:hypothetical protein
MNARSTVLLGTALIVSLIGPNQADADPSKLSDSTFQNWTGILTQVTLNDGSLLNEYVAKTMSSVVENASLVVSFLPRFNCTPIISVIVGAASAVESDSGLKTLGLRIDRKPVDFPVLVDADERGVRYSMNADQAANLELLTLLDKGSRASVVLPLGNPDAAMSADDPETEQNQAGQQIGFSLLGSRSATQAVKVHCQAHIPIPFDN